MGWIAGAALAAAVFAGCGSQPPLTFPALLPAGGLAGKTPSQVLSITLAAADAEGSVHVVSVSGTGRQASGSIYDITGDRGKQVIYGAGGSGNILVLPGIAYQRGDATFLETSEGFPSAAATALAGRWISFRPGDPGFNQVVAADTLASALSLATPTGKLTLGKDTSAADQPVVGVTGKLPSGTAPQGASGTMTLYVSRVAPHLPVEVVQRVTQSGQTIVTTETFSQWGEKVTVTPPSSATPISSLLSGG